MTATNPLHDQNQWTGAPDCNPGAERMESPQAAATFRVLTALRETQNLVTRLIPVDTDGRKQQAVELLDTVHRLIKSIGDEQ